MANENGNNVSVIDGATNNVVATVPVGYYPSSVAANPTTNRIYVAHDMHNSVSVIDGHTNALVTTVALVDSPQGVAVNPATNRIYVANYDNNSVSVIDGVSNAVVATTPVGNGPRGVAVVAATNRAYVANSVGDTVSVIPYPPPPVGGVAEYPQLEPQSILTEQTRAATKSFAIVAVAGGVLLLVASAWYARKHWLA